MKTFMVLATLAALSLGTAASAMTEDEMRAMPASQLELMAKWTLDKYGFDVDTADLTRTQWVAVSSADNDSMDSRSEVKARIESVLKN
ncbi:MAG: hypothetical protein AAGP08_10955 [Pseudomonadota bacterium]